MKAVRKWLLAGALTCGVAAYKEAEKYRMVLGKLNQKKPKTNTGAKES